jgi:WD40 repeat protein
VRSEDLVRGVVRVWTDAEPSQIVGTGVLVAPGLVLTCAHVVARAWGAAPDLDEGAGRRVRIDFPATAPLQWCDAEVVHWLPRRPGPGGAYDLAGLRVEPPHGAHGYSAAPLPLVLEDAPWGKAFRVFGFPAGRPDGSYAAGVLRDALANGWVLVKGGSDAREFTRPGYSGGPVVTDDGMVGLLTEGDRDVRVREAVMVPVRTLLAAWPELQRTVSRSPYPGLASFTAADAANFFGRSSVVRDVTAALVARPHLVVLAGPSGSGKSSLVRAGVLPQLAAGDGDASWCTAVWVPGTAPAASLARALLRARHPEANDVHLSVEVARLARDLGSGRLSVADLLAQGEHERWAIAIDQPEDLLLDDAGRTPHVSSSRGLFEALLAAQRDDRLRGRLALLVAIRTDFLDTLLRAPAMATSASGDAVRYLGPVEDLREVIEGPLARIGPSALEPGLADRLIADVAELPNPLPLLQFTLAELWARQRAGRLTHAAYDTLGGVRRAIANHAERVVGRLDEPEVEAVRDVMLQLGRPGLGDSVARRAARYDELGERGRLVVPRLADARLVVTDRDADGVEVVEVVHEALFEHWPRLRSWWQQAVEFRRWQESLRFALRTWREGGQHTSDLLQGPRLRLAEAQLRERPEALASDELSFIVRSSEREQEVQAVARAALRRQLRFRRRMNVLLGIGMAAALALAATTAWQTSSARRLRDEAERLLHTTASANAALESLRRDLEQATGEARAVLARQLGIEAVANASDPNTFGGSMRSAALMAAHAVALDPGPTSFDHLLRVLEAQPSYRATLDVVASAVAIAPDGRTLIVGDRQGRLSRWDGPTGARLGDSATGHRGAVTALAFSADGSRLVSGGADGRIVEWDWQTLRTWGPFATAHRGPVARLFGTPDGSGWVSGDRGGTVISWEAGSRSPRSTLVRALETLPHTPPRGQIASAAPSSLGAETPPQATSVDAGIPVTAALSGVDELALDAHAAWASAMALHPHRPYLAVALPDGVAVLDAHTLAEQWRLPDGDHDVTGLAFSGNGDRLLTVSASGALQSWRVAAPDAAPDRWALAVPQVRVLAVGPEPDHVLVAGGDGSARWFDLAAGTIVEPVMRQHGSDIVAAAVGRELAMTLSREGRVVTWDREPRLGTGRHVAVVGPQPHGFAIDPSGSAVVVDSTDGSLTRIALSDGSVEAQLTSVHGEYATDAAFVGDVLATIGRDGALVFRDPHTLGELHVAWTHDAPLWRLAVDPERRAVVVGGVRGVVARVSAEPDEAAIEVLRAPSSSWSPGAVVAVAPDGRTWAAAAEPRLELVRDAQTLGRLVERDEQSFWRLEFDPTGDRLLGVAGRNVTLWSVPSLEVLATWTGVSAATFAPDGSLVALANVAGTVQLLDGPTLERIGPPLVGHSSDVRAMRFTPDGATLVSVDQVGDVWRWTTDRQAWLAQACALAWSDVPLDDLASSVAAALPDGEQLEPVCRGFDD